jgi:hypothetical protein
LPSKIDTWLEAHAVVVCPLGRISPEQCMRMRARPTISQWVNKASRPKGRKKGYPTLFKPQCCENCEMEATHA